MGPTKFVYTELRGASPKAQRFYSELFGWNFQDVSPNSKVPYSVIQSGGERVGGATSDGGGGAQWLAYVGVPDVAAATAKARALGATIEVESQAFGEWGKLSVLVDPGGARVALWEGSSSELVSNEWSTIIDHKGIIELRWLPSTSSMTDGGFMATLCLFVGEAEKARPRALLIDATEFKHTFAPGVMAWRDANIIPRYGAAGVRRFAFVVPAGAPSVGTETVEGSAIFPTRWFANRDEAVRWLRA